VPSRSNTGGHGLSSVLITGGTGSFGRAYVKYLLESGAERIVVYSRGEHAQAKMAEEFSSPALRFFIGDVRDRDRLRRALDGVQSVVHAAALKRIEVGQYNPAEMVKTNIIGAMNVIEAATDAGCTRVVALSSDKAWQPVSPYGQSKALAETLFLNANNTRGLKGPIFAVTRYGNVAGSAGSVIPRWREMQKNGMRRVPVTDPDCTRFWMLMDEAVHLVSNTLETMKGGELAIPTLPAYRLGDLAKAMKLQMEITGLPSWEKRHEGMCDGNTSDVARRMCVEELRDELGRI